MLNRIFYCILMYGVSVFSNPIVFNTILSPANCIHRIYSPKDRHIPQPYFSDLKMDKKSMTSPAKAIGSGTFLYHKKTKELEYALSYVNLSSPPVMIHLMLGYAHQDGPILATIIGRPYNDKKHLQHITKKPLSNVKAGDNKTSGFITGRIKLNQLGDSSGNENPIDEEKMLVQGGCYITIHTHLNELGEIRGQLSPLSTRTIRDSK